MYTNDNALNWYKSSYSGNGSNCVEVAMATDAVLTRDSKDPHSPELTFPRAGWSAFLEAVRQ